MSERSERATDRAGRVAHATSRWPVLVRTLVLLGLPLAEAERVAALAVATVVASTGADDHDDHDVALFAAALDAWERDAEPWWREPTASGLDEPLERSLDLLDPAARARLVLEQVARLAPQQVDEVVLGSLTAAPAGLAPAVAAAAEAIEVAGPVPGEVERVSRSRRRTAVAAGVAAAAVLVAGVVVLGGGGEDPSPDGVGEATVGLPRELPISDRVLARVPVPWYDGTSLHVGDVTVELPGLGELEVASDGVAGVLDDGTVIVVNLSGGVTTLGTAPDGVIAGSPSSPGIAWIDEAGSLVVANTPSSRLDMPLPAGAVVVGRDGPTTYVDLPDGHLEVQDAGRYVRRAGPAPVAAAGGVRVDERVGGSAAGLVVTGASDDLELDWLDEVGLSEDGRYLFGIRGAVGVDTVVDLGSGREVRLAITEDRQVVDAAFGEPDDPDALVLVLPLPDTQVRRLGARTDFPGFELVSCWLPRATCESIVRLDTYEIPPRLAH